MATWDEVSRLATELPEVKEVESRGLRQWKVKDKLFVWERPLRGSRTSKRWAMHAPEGPILGARVEHEVAKQALLADDPGCSSRRRTSTAIRSSWCGSTGSRAEGLREVVTESLAPVEKVRDDLADVLALAQVAVRVGGLLDRERLRHDGVDDALLHQLGERLDVVVEAPSRPRA